MSEVGSGQVAIYPTFKGFRSKVNTEADGAGRSGGKAFSSAFSAGAGDPADALVKKLNAQIASGSKALSTARLAEQDAAGKVRVAEAALAEARSKGGAESARAIAAEERLAASQRKLADAQLKTKMASDSLRDSQARLADATAEAGEAGNRSSNRFLAGWQSLRGRLAASVRGSVDEAGSAAESSGKSAGDRAGRSFMGGFGGLVAAGATALGAGMFGGFIAEAARASDATDKFKATMNFAGLDSSAIADATAQAKEYADQTVFDLPTIQNTIAQLASNGVKDYTGLTKAAGNLNAVAGGNADTFKSVAMTMTQTAGAGKLTTENWNQLADAIPGAAGPLMKALEESGAYTGNFRDAMAEGEITADEFNAALMKLGNDPVAVEAAKSTKTFEGAIGGLTATINSGLMSALDALKPTITGAINFVSAGLGKSFAFIGQAWTGLGDLFIRGDFSSALAEAFNVEEDSGFVDFLFRTRDTALEVAGGFRAFGAAWRENNGDVTSDGFAGVMERIANGAREITGGVQAFFAAYKAGDGDITSSGFAGFMERAGFVVREVTGGIRAMFAAFKAGDGDVTSSGFAGFMEQVGNGARQLFDTLAPAISGLLPQLFTLWTAFSPLQIIFAAIQPLLPQIAAMFGQLATTIGGTLATVLTTILPLIMQLSGTISEALGGVLAAVLPTVVTLITMLGSTLSQLLPIVMPIIATILQMAAVLIGQLAPIIAQLVSSVLPPVISIFGLVLGAIGPVIQILAGLLIPIIQALLPVVVTVFGVVADVISSAMQIVQGIIQVVTGIISGNWSQVWEGIGNIFSGIWNAIVSVVRGALQIVGQVVLSGLQLVGNFVLSVLGNIGNFFSDAWRNITSGVRGFIDGFLGFFRDLPGQIMGFLSGAGTWLLGIGKNIIDGLINGITGMAGTVARAILNLVPEAIRGPIEAALGIHSPSRVAMWWMEMIGAGFVKQAPAEQARISRVMDSLVGAPATPAGLTGTGAGAGTTTPARGDVHAEITINQVDDPIGTSTAVVRRLEALGV